MSRAFISLGNLKAPVLHMLAGSGWHCHVTWKAVRTVGEKLHRHGHARCPYAACAARMRLTSLVCSTRCEGSRLCTRTCISAPLPCTGWRWLTAMFGGGQTPRAQVCKALSCTCQGATDLSIFMICPPKASRTGNLLCSPLHCRAPDKSVSRTQPTRLPDMLQPCAGGKTNSIPSSACDTVSKQARPDTEWIGFRFKRVPAPCWPGAGPRTAWRAARAAGKLR